MALTKVAYTSFPEWKLKADMLGWVHCHDDVVVCDDEADLCIGEFEPGAESGWLMEVV